MRPKKILAAVPFVFSLCSVQAETSRLWGTAGESWNSQSRLPDFSFAGYRAGYKPIPAPARTANVKDFGAKGNGQADDTEAFLTAIESADRGVIYIPAGTYKITQPLRISRRGIVLQGEGIDKTKLFFPQPLEKAVGPGKEFSPSDSWSWDGGFIWFEGDNRGEELSDVTAAARRGATMFKVDNAELFHAGQRVRLIMINTDGSLGRHLHDDQESASKLLLKKELVDFSCTVVSVAGNTVTIDRPIRTEVMLAWKPRFEGDAPTVEDVGVENLTIAFPLTRYAGHHDEPGYNGVTFQGVSNGWVRNVRFVNFDCGIVFRARSKFCTVERVEFVAEEGRRSGGWEAHHGVEIADLSQDNLISEFRMPARIIHCLSVTSMATGNVFMKGSGADMTFDHHRKAPYENLYTEIDAGAATDLWMSGGDEEAGPFSAARETFWNIKAANPLGFPNYAIQMNLIGITTDRPSQTKQDGNWLEAIAPDALTPKNLYESQLQRRHR